MSVRADDRESIREATFRYARGVDRLDVELMKSAYWPDATDGITHAMLVLARAIWKLPNDC